MDKYRGQACEVYDSQNGEWLAAQFVALSLSTVLMEPLVQIKGRMPWFATWGTFRGIDRAELLAYYGGAPEADCAGYIQYVDGQQTQNFFRTVEERKQGERIVRAVLKEGQIVTYETVYKKPFAGPGNWFPVDLYGNPMREFAPGKWETAKWPSEPTKGQYAAPITIRKA